MLFKKTNLLIAFLLIANIGFSQKKNPDSLYYKATKQTTYQYKEAHPKETAQMYYNTSKKYRLLTTDVVAYFQYAVACSDSLFIIESGRLWILNSAEKVDDMFEKIKGMNLEAKQKFCKEKNIKVWEFGFFGCR